MPGLRTAFGRGITVKTSKGRFAEEKNFSLFLRNTRIAHGKHFRGRGDYRPWIEASIIKKYRKRIIRVLCDLLPPGSHIMIGYSNYTETKHGLKRGFPESATPLGFILWECGCRWFKDWYFAEGFKEGGVKLQGELPLNENQGKQLEKKAGKELRKFLDSSGKGFMISRAKMRARKILKTISMT